MNYRVLGRTGWKVSEISFGAWAIGGAWGDVSDADPMIAGDQEEGVSVVREQPKIRDRAQGIGRTLLLYVTSL